MAWVIVEDGAVVREFSRPTAFTYKDLQYPRNWIQNATDAEKSAIGLVEVTISGGQKSSDYYNSSLGNLVIASDGSVSRTWTNTAKTLSTVQSQKVKEAKRDANNMLYHTDWYVVRKAETDVAVPGEITAYRTAVRTCYGNLKTAINVEPNTPEEDITNMAAQISEYTSMGALFKVIGQGYKVGKKIGGKDLIPQSSVAVGGGAATTGVAQKVQEQSDEPSENVENNIISQTTEKE